MPSLNEEIDVLRRGTEKAYARWRACAAEGLWTEAGDIECRLLKRDLDTAAQLLFAARRPSMVVAKTQ